MSLYDTYSQKYQAALAPAIDYLQRSQAASAVGLDYNKLTAEQVQQYFGSSPYSATSAIPGVASNSSLNNLLYQATGGSNPYVQQLQAIQYQNLMYQQSLMQNAYFAGYPQFPQQQAFNPSVFNAPTQFAGYPQPNVYANIPSAAPVSQGVDLNQLVLLLTALEGLDSETPEFSGEEVPVELEDNSGLAFYNQLFARAMDTSSTYDSDYLKKLEEKIAEIQKEAASEESEEA